MSVMVNPLTFTEENAKRIAVVESLFGPLGKPLAKPGRVLVGEGQLTKLCRRRPQPKMFFLFNDVLVYGSILLQGRRYNRQHVIPMEDVALEDMEDGLEMKNQWLIRTPRKSFSVSAASPQEKSAWMEHIGDCRSQHLLCLAKTHKSTPAAVWVPDWASAICMRCSSRFSSTHRRHHCRQCGYVVCGNCSQGRHVLQNISHKPVRVCSLCHQILRAQDEPQGRRRGDSDGKNWSDEDELYVPVHEASSDEEADDEDPVPKRWSTLQNQFHGISWSPFIYIRK